MNTFMPALYVQVDNEPYTLLENGTTFKDELDITSLYYIVKNEWAKNTWLAYEKRPFIIWTGCHGNITPLDLVDPTPYLEKIKQEGLLIYLYEPLSTYRINIENKFPDHKFYDQFESTQTNINSVRSYELDSIQRFAEKYDIHTITVFTCEYNIGKYYQQHYPWLNLKCQDIFLAADAIVKEKLEPAWKTKKIHKKFWCGNWRYNGVRHLVMMYLASTNSFFSGNYSWYVYGGHGHVNGKLWFDMTKWKDTDPALMSRIIQGEKRLNDVVPLSMDIQEPPMFFVGDEVNKNPPKVGSYRLPLQYAECFVAIVNESRFAQPTANFSEKIFNTVRACKPFVTFAPPHTLEYFREQGFKTFGDFWDESYDEEEDHEQRLIKIFKVIDYIDSLTIYDMRNILGRMAPILEHNLQRLHGIALEGRIFS